MDKLKLDIQRFAATPPTSGNLIDEECLYEYHQNIERDYAKKTDIPTETVLYNSTSGTTGGITLSETSANFNYIEVYFHSDNEYRFERIYSPNGKTLQLTCQTLDTSTPMIYGKTKKITFSGTSLTVNNYSQYTIRNNATGYVRSDNNTIYIVRVVGYK